ncbi:hypothetical protein AVDCRST_MAG94-3915, partial [uncultured Leptolyngbya sp.]
TAPFLWELSTHQLSVTLAHPRITLLLMGLVSSKSYKSLHQVGSAPLT